MNVQTIGRLIWRAFTSKMADEVHITREPFTCKMLGRFSRQWATVETEMDWSDSA